MDGPEPPILDGSAAQYVGALQSAGVALNGGAADYLCVSEAFSHEESGARYEVSPSSSLDLEVRIEFDHPLVGAQHGRWVVTPDTFARELAPARTFGFAHEIEMLRAQGLIQGASTQNALLLDEGGVVENTLRWPDEFVRHKAMDCVGDLALAGRRVRARIVAHRPSHRGTVTLVRELLRRAPKERRVSGIDEIMQVLPHRYPFLLVDRILEQEAGKRAVGIKNVTINEPFFQGHFPGHPVMPGVLIVEALAQAGAIAVLSEAEHRGKLVLFGGIDGVRFKRIVRPGDTLELTCELERVRGPVGKGRARATVDGELAARGTLTFAVADPSSV
jgi:UDP-3-O-[3-hydroxymyristoyl] N-acetylglucosamine deacetylase/3-hydroxyacyl-[acyl-carrier-protein] dehydratase